MLLPRYSDITHGLTQRPARISPKYFYDQHGSQLFEAITRLPEYYPTRTEMALMQAHADSIAGAIGRGRTLIELGAGNCQKARTLCRLVQPACFVGVDISADFLEQAVQGLRDEFPALDARALAGDMTLGVSLPDDIPRTGRLVFYPGSSIGNFDPPHALDLLAHMRELVDDDGGLLIGIDLPKDVAVLEAAYDDGAGVTAEFNRTVLNWVVDMSSIGAAIGYGFTSAATLAQVRRNKDTSAWMTINSILGVIFSLCFIALLIVPNPWAYLGPQSRIALVIWTVMGAAFFLYTRRKKAAEKAIDA